MIRSGEDVRIVDNNSKDDLTAITLTQIIFEEEKKQSFLPLSALRNIIQSGAQNITQFTSQAGEKVRGIFKREKDEEGGGGGETAETTEAAVADGSNSSTHPIREFLERSQQTFDERQKPGGDRLRAAMEALPTPSGQESDDRAAIPALAH